MKGVLHGGKGEEVVRGDLRPECVFAGQVDRLALLQHAFYRVFGESLVLW